MTYIEPIDADSHIASMPVDPEPPPSSACSVCGNPAQAVIGGEVLCFVCVQFKVSDEHPDDEPPGCS